MSGPTFDAVWDRIRALEGLRIPLAERGEIDVVMVDDRGIVRRSSHGRVARMSIESFRWAVAELNRRRQLDRLEILKGIRRWESSGVVAILAATGLFEITRGSRLGLRVRPTSSERSLPQGDGG
jgi:hypothetical protein